MAIRHHSTVLCDYLIRADNGRFSYIGVFQNIRAAELPTAKEMALSVVLDGDPQDRFQIAVRGPGEFVVAFEEVSVGDPPARESEFQQWSITVAMMARLTFREAGLYRVVLSSGDAVIHEYEFGVFLASQDVEGEQLPVAAEGVSHASMHYDRQLHG
jgi:hypothetical protein